MIYVIKHKPCEVPLLKGYKEFGVGECFEQDKSLDNIEHLNPYINELTGIYWLWKHSNDDVIGIHHYHRYFSDMDNYIPYSTAEQCARRYDIVLTKPLVFDCSLLEWFIQHDFPNWLPEFYKYLDMFVEKEPDFYNYLQGNTTNARNMFIARKEILDRFCEWLFPIVIPIAEKFFVWDSYKYNDMMYKRMIGYISERLLPYWVRKENLNYHELSIIEF